MMTAVAEKVEPNTHTFVQILNWVIIAICLFLKIPQIFNLRSRRPSEVRGLSCHAIVMEIAGYSIMSLYNYKNNYNILTYLEYPVILMQVFFMLFYVLRAKGYLKNLMVPIALVLYIKTMIGFMTEVIPRSILMFIVPICTPLSGFAKVTYIVGMIKMGNSDAISIETWCMSVLTNAARLFCVYMDSADKNLMFNYAVSVVLSSMVLGTALYYQMQPPPRPIIATRRREPSVRRHYHLD